jgi:hypothetical protein
MNLLIDALVDVRTTTRLDIVEWNRLLLQARYHGLLARLWLDLSDQGLCEAVPAAARRQLNAARIEAEANQTTIRFEIDRVRTALCGLGIPVVLLKGGAYLAAGLPAARGRLSVDLDILVPRTSLSRVEGALLAKGWRIQEVNDYDDKYYRQWTHELPPFWQPERETLLDVHHTIFPPVSGIKIDGNELLSSRRPLDNGLAILQPCDLVLHSALHLFGEDPSNRLRDLVDLRDLIQHYSGQSPEFWPDLVRRAQQLRVTWALGYAAHHLGAIFGVPIPPAVRLAIVPRDRLRQAVTNRLIASGIVGGLHDEAGPWVAVGQFLLYMRSHWIKMPPLLLVRHLWVKSRLRNGERA